MSLSSEVDDDFEYLIKIKFKYKLFLLWLWENWDVVNPLNQHVTQFYHAILPSMPKTERPQRDKNNIHLLVIIHNKLYKFLRCRCFQIRVNCFGIRKWVSEGIKFPHDFAIMITFGIKQRFSIRELRKLFMICYK